MSILEASTRSCKTASRSIGLSRYVVGLRERHMDYWTPYSGTNLREHNSNRSYRQRGAHPHSSMFWPARVENPPPAYLLDTETLPDLKHRMRGVWRDAELVDPNTHNNKLATYHSWFAIPFSRNEHMPIMYQGISIMICPNMLCAI